VFNFFGDLVDGDKVKLLPKCRRVSFRVHRHVAELTFEFSVVQSFSGFKTTSPIWYYDKNASIANLVSNFPA
jgi:hypothetical protein